MTRILHVVPTYLPATRYGGPIYSVHSLCKALAAAGHDVHVFATSVDGDQDSDVPLDSPVVMDGVKVWYFPSKYLRRLFWSPAMLRRMKSEIGSFDILHLHSVFLWPTWAAARLARKLRVPFVLSPRGMLVKELVRRKSFWAKMVWIRLIESRNIRRASLLHFTADIERQEFEAFGFRIRGHCTIPNGMDLPLAAETCESSADVKRAIAAGPYLLFLGRLNWKKGLDRLISALPSIPGCRLVIAGNDEEGYLQTILEIVAEHAVQDRVSIIPRFVSGRDKSELYRNATLFVLPSYSENFGITVAEAMASSCPVVVTPEVGAAEMVRAADCGCVTEAGDLAGTIVSLLNDRAKLRASGLAGKGWVEQNLAWKSVAESMLRQYQAVIAGELS